MRIRIVQPSHGAAGRVEVFEPTATVDNAASGMAGQTVVPLSQYTSRADSLWPVPVQRLLQQLVQLPASIANSVRAYGGDCILLGPPAAPAAALASELPAGALRVTDLASNPLFHALAQDKPALAQMLLMTAAAERSTSTAAAASLAAGAQSSHGSTLDDADAKCW
ncbi:hypothetical protein GGF32_005199 [Allomyces javanicus]|nr:hypothetical protein GGF32_005199 [Allomyces javanicus]